MEDIETETSHEPQPKRCKFLAEQESAIDEDEYEEAVEHLQVEFKNKGKGKKGSLSYVKDLMMKTRFRRHQWISNERPMISEVVEKFPYLSRSRWVSISYSRNIIQTLIFCH